MADAKKCDRCGKYYITNEQEFKGWCLCMKMNEVIEYEGKSF
jgi:hypothetical protein